MNTLSMSSRGVALALALVLVLGACASTPPNTLGPEGGAVEHTDGVRIEVPPGALVDKVTFEINKSALVVPGALGPAYALSPQGLTFLQPVRVTLPYKRTDLLPTDVDEPVFVLRAAASGALTDVGGTIASKGQIQLQVTDLAVFAPASHAPGLIAGQQGAPLGLALTTSHIYWTQRPGAGQAGSVMRAALGGPAASTTGQPEVFVADRVDPRHLLIAGGFLYLGYGGSGSGDGGIARVPLQGGLGLGTSTTLAPATAPGPLALDDEAIYFVDGEALMRAELSGGAATLLAATGVKPTALCADADHLYWASRGEIGGLDGRIMRVAKKGGTAVALATGQAEPAALALDQEHLYWVNKGDGRVRRAPLAGGEPSTLRALMRPTAIALHGDTYSVADVLSAKLLVYPKAGGKGLARSTTAGSVGRIVADDHNLYWLTEGTQAAQGSVRLIPR